MRYYIADNHFFHEGINFRMDHRGFKTVELMNEYMIEKWNSRVRRNDEVVILGDFSIGKAEETNDILSKLHGRLYIICGNHDKWLQNKSANLSRFKWIKDYAEMNDNGRKVILCHYPIMCYNGQFRINKDGNPKVYMLHGHVHKTQDVIGIHKYKEFVRNYPRQCRGSDDPKPAPINIINCFCMYSDYVPLTLDEWIVLEDERIDIKSVQNDWRYDL